MRHILPAILPTWIGVDNVDLAKQYSKGELSQQEYIKRLALRRAIPTPHYLLGDEFYETYPKEDHK